MNKLLVIAVLGIFGCSCPSRAHDVMSGDVLINPPVQEADRANARLNFLQYRGLRAGVSTDSIMSARAFYYKKFVWTKSVLKICFWNGTPEQRRDVMELASTWTKAVPTLSFDVGPAGSFRTCAEEGFKDYKALSDIRITLDATDQRPLWHKTDSREGDWSYPGRSVAQDTSHPTTMNLVGAMESRARNQMTNYVFNVRHEFGHALGLVHEHQRSVCDGWFAIDVIAKDLGWSSEFTRAQIGSLGETSNAYGVVGVYDVSSIMQYNFAPSWYVADKPTAKNPCRRREDVEDLSELDKVAIAELYDPALNRSPARIALIDRQRSAAAPVAVAAAGARTAVDRSSVEAALAGFRPAPTDTRQLTIQLYLKPGDGAAVLAASANLGYPLTDGTGRPILTRGHPTSALLGDPTNAILYTKDVSEQDIRYIAFRLKNSGIAITSVEPYQLSVNNNFTPRNHLVQVGSSIRNRTRQPLTDDDILNRPLPLFGAPR